MQIDLYTFISQLNTSMEIIKKEMQNIEQHKLAYLEQENAKLQEEINQLNQKK